MSETQWVVGDRRSFVHKFTKEEIEQFARLTGDLNPLHVDENYARKTPAGGTVVHGMLAASFISTLVGMHIPGPGALWNSFAVNWRKMIRVGDRLRFEVRVAGISPSTGIMELEMTGTHTDKAELYLDAEGKVMTLTMGKNENDGPETFIAETVPQTLVHNAPLVSTPLSSPKPHSTAKIDPREKLKNPVLITGASGELGKEICKRLAEQGMRLILWGRDKERLNEISYRVGRQLESRHEVDLTDSTAIEEALRASIGKEIYGFVHAASPPLAYATVDDPKNLENLREQWQVGVAAFSQICQAIVPAMKNGGSIVSILSQYTWDVPPIKLSAYVSAKMAAWGLIRSLAAELGPRGIRCNAISPGVMNTPYSKDVPLRLKQVEAATNPMRRLCTVEDVAEAVAFLMGPGAEFISGVNLPVTGGIRMP